VLLVLVFVPRWRAGRWVRLVKQGLVLQACPQGNLSAALYKVRYTYIATLA
jgi:hypothetical protein